MRGSLRGSGDDIAIVRFFFETIRYDLTRHAKLCVSPMFAPKFESKLTMTEGSLSINYRRRITWFLDFLFWLDAVDTGNCEGQIWLRFIHPSSQLTTVTIIADLVLAWKLRTDQIYSANSDRWAHFNQNVSHSSILVGKCVHIIMRYTWFCSGQAYSLY